MRIGFSFGFINICRKRRRILIGPLINRIIVSMERTEMRGVNGKPHNFLKFIVYGCWFLNDEKGQVRFLRINVLAFSLTRLHRKIYIFYGQCTRHEWNIILTCRLIPLASFKKCQILLQNDRRPFIVIGFDDNRDAMNF